MVGGRDWESMVSWRRLSYLLIVMLVAQLLYTHGLRNIDFVKLDDRPRPASNKASPFKSKPNGYDAEIYDEIVDGLSTAQCNEIFPDIGKDVDRAVAYWKDRQHTITTEDGNAAWAKEGLLRILIHENELRVLESRNVFTHLGYYPRGRGILSLLQRAVESASAAGEQLPTIETSIILYDNPYPPSLEGTETYWSWAARLDEDIYQRVWLVPNFDIWFEPQLGSFREARRRAVHFDAPFADKIQKLVWRGSSWTNVIRKPLLELAKDKPWADILQTDGDDNQHNAMDPDQLCRYAMTLHTEGISYSGRLKYLLNCNSLLFFHEPQWKTYEQHLLIGEGPYQNYVPVNRNWTDLEEKVNYYILRPYEAEQIVKNAVTSLRDKYLVRASTSCYFRKLIQGYGSVSVTPSVNRPAVPGKAIKRRGYSFETFMNNVHDGNLELEAISADTT